MSPYTTITVTRAHAIEMYIKGKDLFKLITNEDLGNMLDNLYSDETLYNYIVSDEENTDESFLQHFPTDEPGVKSE